MGWSGDNHRTADRRYVAALNVSSTGGWGASLHVTGEYVVLDSCSGRELGRIPYHWQGDDATTRLELDCERAEGSDGGTVERLVARTILMPYDRPDDIVTTHTFALPTADELGAPPEAPFLLFELADPPITRERLVNAVDALRGRLALAGDLRARDPRWVRLVARDRVAVELRGVSEQEVLAALALDRPAILSLDPFEVLVESTNPYSGPELLQLRIRTSHAGPLPDQIQARVDGQPLGSVPRERIPIGRGHINLPAIASEHQTHVRLLPYPLRSRLRRVEE